MSAHSELEELPVAGHMSRTTVRHRLDWLSVERGQMVHTVSIETGLLLGPSCSRRTMSCALR